MANTTSSLNQSLSKLNDAALRMARRAIDDNVQFAGELRNFFSEMGLQLPGLNLGSAASKKHHSHCQCGCCPPECACPPHCMIVLNRTAFRGETIIVPFTVRNTTGSAKTYQVGVRELLDQQGNHALQQPALNQPQISLEPHQAITLWITLQTTELAIGTYQTEIVLREKDVNQNICFHLAIVPLPTGPEAHPVDEKRYSTHFQGWQSHFYCTPSKKDGSLSISHSADTSIHK